MNQEILQWIVSGLVGIMGFMICLILRRLDSIEKRLETVASDYIITVQRLTKMEATLEYMGYVAAKAAHRPHNPELDALLEKYYRVYEEKSYDMSNEEWSELKKICEGILDDVELPSGFRFAVGIVLALCKHKGMRLK
jgi:hypothetical protein